MDIESYILGSSYTNQEIAKVNQTITNVTSGIKSVTQQNGNQLVFTLNDNTVVTLTVTGLSSNDYTTTEKDKLASLDANILTLFTYVDGKLLFNGQSIANGTLDLSTYLKTVDADNKYEAKDSSIVKDSNYVHTDVNFAQVDKNKLDTLENFSKDYNDLVNKPDLTGFAKTTDVNTELSVKADVLHTQDISTINNLQTELNNRYIKNDTMSKTEIQTLVNSITKNMTWKDSVATMTDLNNLTGMVNGETRVVTGVSTIYTYDGTKWVNLGSSSNIPLVTITNDGQMSKEDKAKLDSIIVANLVTNSQLTSALSSKADISSVPTKTSQITNDSDFATNSSVDGKLANYQTGTQIDTKLIDYAKLTDLSNRLNVGNIKAGSNITLTVSGNDVTISSSGGTGGNMTYVLNQW